MNRSLTVTWQDPMALAQAARSMSGLEFLQGVRDGKLAPAPIQELIGMKLVDQGNTVVVIEHNLDVIKSADHVIDLGPEGGEQGGRLVAQGTPETVARSRESFTGRFLADILRPPPAQAAS